MNKLTTEQQTILSFHNYMNCDCQLTEDMFLVAWDDYRKNKEDKYPCKKIFDGNCTGINKPFCYKTCKFYKNYTKLTKDIKRSHRLKGYNENDLGTELQIRPKLPEPPKARKITTEG